MTTSNRILLIVVATFTLATGCTHHKNLESCTPQPGQIECWQSSDLGPDGRLGHQVVERVTVGEGCDLVELEHTYFDQDGVLQERMTEARRCGVVEARVIERYDVAGDAVVIESFADRDHDDHFETAEVERRALTAEQKAFALARS
jgi:hypothetical protein